MSIFSKFGAALVYHFHAFGVQPISTVLVCALVLDIIIVASCLIKLAIIYHKERKSKSRKAYSY